MCAPVITIIISFLLIYLLLEGRYLFKHPLSRESILAYILILISCGYGLDLSQGWNFLPNPSALFEAGTQGEGHKGTVLLCHCAMTQKNCPLVSSLVSLVGGKNSNG